MQLEEVALQIKANQGLDVVGSLAPATHEDDSIGECRGLCVTKIGPCFC